MSSSSQHTSTKHGVAALTLGALGVVYGDIGTSPTYTLTSIFTPSTGVKMNDVNLIGTISVILWMLMLVVTLKYVVLILRADNRGEGGGLALTALATHAVQGKPRLRQFLLLLGVFGATLFYGDSVITPAISVMGAVEGMEVITPSLTPYVLPLSLGVLIALFFIQRFGTSVVGKVFGPVLTLWFIVLAITGIHQIQQQPTILQALNPYYALEFLLHRGWHVFAVLGGVVLALTGAEALYADMGHFGRQPIRLAWTSLVLPSLALNYMGQGALLMRDPTAIQNPFFRLFPESLVPIIVVLATMAAVIASQAVISGAYSMTKQAIQLGFLPRMTVRNTSAREAGQIYMPAVNWALLAGVIGAVLLFGSSSALAGAYGIAVTMTMMITTVLTYFVIRDGWGIKRRLAIPATLLFLVLDTLLVAGCIIKFFDGGWFPLALGLVLFVVMSTWARGRQLLIASIERDGLELEPFIESLALGGAYRAERTAVYAVANAYTVPPAMLHNLKHNQVLHQTNIIMTVKFEDRPFVPDEERVVLRELAPGFWRVVIHYGFMDQPDVPQALALCEPKGLRVPVFETSYFLSRETVVPTPGGGMSNWRERMFAAMTRNAGGVAEFFRLPDNAVVELGARVQI